MRSRIYVKYFLTLVIIYHNLSIKTSIKTSKTSHGAIVALLHGTKPSDFQTVVDRNKSVLKYFWRNETESKIFPNPDIVLFHEGNIGSDSLELIASQTPDLNIIYKQIQFDGHAILNNESDITSGIKLGNIDEVNPFESSLILPLVYPKCHKTPMVRTGWGNYKNMCRFWFIGFLEYLDEYDWIYRLDTDCELVEDSKEMFYNFFNEILDYEQVKNMTIVLSSPGWIPLHRLKYDRVASEVDGPVVTGMGPFVREFAMAHGNNKTFDSWNAPYTNAMFMNLQWYHAASNPAIDRAEYKLLRDFVDAVDKSNCIYSNRWGDLPLWGAALSLIDHPVSFLPLSYHHESHSVTIQRNSRSGFFRPDIPFMIVFGDHADIGNRTMNTRIDVIGHQGVDFI